MAPSKQAACLPLAYEFHKNNVQLVYGGGTTGLTGDIAKTLVALSGPKSVHGVIPRALVRVSAENDGAEELDGAAEAAERVLAAGTPIDERDCIPESEYGVTTIMPDMHTRKRLMATKVMEGGPGSGFVSLADDDVDQLGIHHAGVVLLNVNGYWDGVGAWLPHAVSQGFISAENGRILAETSVSMLMRYRGSSDRMLLNWGG
ncbi:hypothetical protein BDW66DRAFT_157720 [Aspergillus desertorum]